jgi:predicted secreted hydrolase
MGHGSWVTSTLQNPGAKLVTFFTGVILAAIFLLTVSIYGEHNNGWKQAVGPWKWSFPRDHGSHPDFRTEWWYFTGNVTDTEGKQYGYQLTFFRQGVLKQPKDTKNPWSIRDLYLAHFTLTDTTGGRFAYEELSSRTGPGLAGAARDGMDVRLLGWSARMHDNTIHIEARHESMQLSLDLVPKKPVVLHGEHGLSKKGTKTGQASYYYSYTNLQTDGFIMLPRSSSSVRVRGTSWFDHEFGSNQLASDQRGWDWFSIHLSNGQDLMIYLLRRGDGSIEPASSGTLVDRAGIVTHLKLEDISITVLDRWKSQRSGATYPSNWRISIPSQQVELVIRPLVANQELITEGSTGITYWEGAVNGNGRSAGKQVNCEGYVEMTGYARSMGATF